MTGLQQPPKGTSYIIWLVVGISFGTLGLAEVGAVSAG